MRMIFHAVDMAVTNAWIEYKMDCKQKNYPKKDILDLLDFRLNLSRALTSVGKTVVTKKRGRPASLKMMISQHLEELGQKDVLQMN